MGMAASQARYLALTARKTNTEYEGQQINQARTALANQSANLFNQLLGMEVPNPPKTSDYTTLQYSYSDGENDLVIDDWEQLSGVNPDYNYLVNSHYFASLYTGSMKQLMDPQVQIGGPNGTPFADWENIVAKKTNLNIQDGIQQMNYETYQNTRTSREATILDIQTSAQANNNDHSAISNNITNISATNTEYTLTDVSGNIYTVNKNAPEYTILQGIKDMFDTDIMDLVTLNDYLADSGVFLQESDIESLPSDIDTDKKNAILSSFYLETDGTDNNTRIVGKKDIDRILSDVSNSPNEGDTNRPHSLSGVFLSSGDTTIHTLNFYASEIERNKNTIQTAYNDYMTAYNLYQTALGEYNALGKPTYIGNSELTPIFESDLTEEQKIELLQVVKDMKAQDIDTDIINCFDSADDSYLGGIYSFKMNGTTYYTTQKNLEEAYNSYPENGSNNVIDVQYRMPYYNASYVDTRIENTSHALLETDGNGRFKTVKFENDSVVYALNTETVTDEAAYDDAMNKYLYEKEKYEKMIADINAKTSIIQKEDRTLELRLKQLETEQNAVKTEIDAVKKVIKDNIEKTFKTFSD